MRDILFRGKRVDNGKWLQGSLLSFGDGGKAILPSKSKVFLQNGTTTICCNECYEIDHTTVGRYIGVTDKNGVKIFEGDAIAFEGSSETFEIWWSSGACGFVAGRRRRVWPNLNPGTVARCEVRGNIHDNPELREKTEA